MPCLGCALDKINKETKKIIKTNKPKTIKLSSNSRTTKTNSYPNSVSPNLKNTVTDFEKFFAWAIIFVVILIALSYIFKSETKVTTPPISLTQPDKDDINQLIETLKNSSNSTTITEQSLPTEKKYIFSKVADYIVTEFNNNNPKSADGLDVYTGLRFKGLSGVMWHGYSASNCKGNNLGLLKACYSLEGDGNFACQWDAEKANKDTSYCLESLEK